jgi:hypothetical protein
LGDLDGTGSHGLLQAFGFGKVDVCKTLSLVDFDFCDTSKYFHGLFDEWLGDALTRVRVLEEGLLASWCRGW